MAHCSLILNARQLNRHNWPQPSLNSLGVVPRREAATVSHPDALCLVGGEVDEVTTVVQNLLDSLVTSAEPRNREVEAERACTRASERFGVE